MFRFGTIIASIANKTVRGAFFHSFARFSMQTVSEPFELVGVPNLYRQSLCIAIHTSDLLEDCLGKTDRLHSPAT